MKQRLASRGPWIPWGLGVFGTLAGGCATTTARVDPAGSQTDRFARVYPELRGGRFLIIADFEDEKHLDLFATEGGSETAGCTLDRKGGRAETGRNALACTAVSAGDEIVIGNHEGARWYLKRDWRAYDLLLVSVNAARAGLALEATISSGATNQRASAWTTLRLDKGWNVLRLDLAEVAGLVSLDDVLEMRWAFPDIDGPTRVIFDDIVLTSNREDVFGDSRNPVGGLYAQRVGRRWNIGAAGKFELTFAHGQITAWYNLTTDPNRVRNFVQGTALGPTPVVISADGSELGDFSALGRTVAATQRLLEVNRVRAVVTSEWHFVDDLDQPTDGRPFQRWVHTIYPTGQVFVTVEATARTDAWTPPGLGLAVSLASPTGEEWKISTEEGASAHNATANAELLLAVHAASAPMVSRYDPVTKRVSMITPPVQHAAVARWSAMLSVGDSTERGRSGMLSAYRTPDSIHLEQGRSRGEIGDAARNVTLDPGSGCFEIEAEQGRVRFALEGTRKPITAPCFAVSQAGEGACWVYVDHRIHEATARSHDGHLIFQIPGTPERRVLVEVLCNR